MNLLHKIIDFIPPFFSLFVNIHIMSGSVVGGKLKFKGGGGGGSGSKDGKAVAKKPILEKTSSTSSSSSSSTTSSSNNAASSNSTSNSSSKQYLTEAEIKHREKRAKADAKEAAKKAKQSYTERLDSYNKYLSKLPAHNDIPKISAAGNG